MKTLLLALLALFGLLYILTRQVFPASNTADKERYIDEVVATGNLVTSDIDVLKVMDISRGYSWQINLTNTIAGNGLIRLFASVDCTNFTEIINSDPENPLPAPWSGNGTVIINVANAYYRCTKINISNIDFDDVNFAAILSRKEGF